jgi:hypothetical protein
MWPALSLPPSQATPRSDGGPRLLPRASGRAALLPIAHCNTVGAVLSPQSQVVSSRFVNALARVSKPIAA